MELEFIIAAWLDNFEDRRLPRGDNERIEAFMILLKTLKEKHGAEKDRLAMVKSAVMIHCTNDSVGPQKHTRWKNMLEKLFNTAVIRIWPEQFIQPTEEEKNPTKIKLAPEPPKPDKVEEEPEEVPRMGREITDAMLDRVEKPVVIYNEDFDKLIGMDSDE